MCEYSVAMALGFIQYRRGNHREAADCFREALDLLAGLGSLYKLAETAEHLAEAYQALGDQAEARAALRDAFAVFTELQHPRATGVGSKLCELDRTGSQPFLVTLARRGAPATATGTSPSTT